MVAVGAAVSVGEVVGVNDANVAVAGSGAGVEAPIALDCMVFQVVSTTRIKAMNPPIIQREFKRDLGAGSLVGASCLRARGGSGVMISAVSEEASGKTSRK